MREFTCIVCGAKGIDTSHSQNKMFCGLECKNFHWRKTHAKRTIEYEQCIYNEGVECTLHRCGRCGWNPTVAKKRLEVAHG